MDFSSSKEIIQKFSHHFHVALGQGKWLIGLLFHAYQCLFYLYYLRQCLSLLCHNFFFCYLFSYNLGWVFQGTIQSLHFTHEPEFDNIVVININQWSLSNSVCCPCVRTFFWKKYDIFIIFWCQMLVNILGWYLKMVSYLPLHIIYLCKKYTPSCHHWSWDFRLLAKVSFS